MFWKRKPKEVPNYEKIKAEALAGEPRFRILQLAICQRWIVQERFAWIDDGDVRLSWSTFGGGRLVGISDDFKFKTKKDAEAFLNRHVNPQSFEYDHPPLVERKKEKNQ